MSYLEGVPEIAVWGLSAVLTDWNGAPLSARYEACKTCCLEGCCSYYDKFGCGDKCEERKAPGARNERKQSPPQAWRRGFIIGDTRGCRLTSVQGSVADQTPVNGSCKED